MANPYLPPRLRGGGYRSSRFALPAGAGRPADLDFPDAGKSGGGILGTGLGPDLNLGLGQLFREIGQGATALGAMVAPGSKKGEPGFANLLEGVGSSLGGTVADLSEYSPVNLFGLLDDNGRSDRFREQVGRALGDSPEEEEALTPRSFGQNVSERGLLPTVVETVGNVSLVGAAVTAPVKGASMAARLGGRAEAAARIAAAHSRMIDAPLMQAVQHPYRTAGRALRTSVTAPAASRVLAASGIDDVPLNEAPIDFLAAELPDTGVDYRKVQVDLDEHRQRAEAYQAMPDDDPAAHGAYQAFADEVAEQYRHVTEDLGVSFEFVDEDPYPSYKEMLADVRENRRLKVYRTKDGEHPFLTPEQNDQFRAVHDLYGHAATGRDFARHGEEAAFLAHSSMFSPDAQKAMATETRGQNAVLITSGEFGPQKVGLLPEDLADPAAAVARFQKANPMAPPGAATKFLAAIEEKLVAHDARRKIMDETRLAEMERRIAGRSTAVRSAVHVARDHLMEAGKAQGIRLTRKEASLIVGDELRSRLTGVKALEDKYLGLGVPEAAFIEAGIRERFVPTELRTPEIETALTEAVAAQLAESQNVRAILTEGRRGDEGLTGLADDAAVEPALTPKQERTLRAAEKKLERAHSEVLDRKIARERRSREGYVAAQKDKLGRISAAARRVDEESGQAVAAFDHSRTWVPKALKTPEALTATAQRIYEQTITNVAQHDGEWGGASFNPHTGRFVEGGKDTGYAVGLVPGTALEIPFDQFNPANIEQVIRAYQDVFRHPNTVVGTWVEDGKVYIDPSEIVPTLDEAMIRGGARGQLSTYDIGRDNVVDGILKDRPDIAAAFLDRHTHLSKRAGELRDVAAKTGMPEGDVGRMLDLLMRQAVRAQDAGLVSHPDEFFQKHVSKFEFATKRSTRFGTLGQIVLERSARTPEERASLWKEMEASVADLDKVRAWYDESHDLVERLFRAQPDITLLDGSKINPADLMYQLVAITSFQATPRDNWTRAMVAMQRFDELPRKEFRALSSALKKVTSGKATLEEAFGLGTGAALAERFAGFGLYPEPRQYLAEVLSGRHIETWTPEYLGEVALAFGKKERQLDRARALDFIESEHPGLIERIGEDAAVKEFYGRSHRAKIITFWDNLRNPDRSLGVTMDQQMERLFGEEVPLGNTKTGTPNDAWIRYSEQVRDMADELSETLGERIMPHQLQAIMWVFAKDEVNRLQMGHFNALANDAVDMVREGLPILDETDPILQWIDEASEPYRTEGQRHVRQHRILRPDGSEAVEDVVYRPGWGASNREKKIGLFEKRRVDWLAARENVNASLAVGDMDGALAGITEFVTRMQTKAPRSNGLADDASGASFFDIWMKGEFHSAGYQAAANALDRLDYTPGEYPPLLQSFKDKVLGEFVPMDDGTRGVIRIFEDGNLATLVHENGHLLRRLLPAAEVRAVERAYRSHMKRGRWTVAAEERFANDFLRYMQSEKAPAGLKATFARVREALADIWHLVRGSMHRGRVHPELKDIFDSWLDPALRPMPEGEIPGLPPTAAEAGTMAQRVLRPPKFPEPPAKKGDFYAAGRKGQKALANLERLAARQRQLSVAAAQVQSSIDAVRQVLDENRLPSQLERDALIAQGTKMMEQVDEAMGKPSIARTPARWQPLWDATLRLGKEAETNPELAGIFEDLPQTLHEVQNLALTAGFDPAHVRDFTPRQVRRLVFGNMRLGLGRDLLHEAQAGTRKSRSGALAKAGGVDRSVEALLASTIEAVNEKRTNAVIDWVEGNVSRRIEAGQVIPPGWALWDPVRTYLLTGTELSADAQRTLTTSAQHSMIVPEAVVRTVDRFTKDYEHWAFKAVRKVTSPWRTLVLTLSPGWYVRNFVGNMVLGAAEGAGLADWRAAWRSFRSKDEIGRFADLPFVTSDTLAQEAAVMADDSVIPRRGLGEAQAEAGRLRGAAQFTARHMLRVNEVVDEFARAAVYHQGLRLNMTPEEAWKKAKVALVDYGALSPFEREAVRAVIPFYAWQKGILKVTMNQALDHPARVALLSLLGRMQEEYLADRFGVDTEDLPDYYKHLVGDRNLRSFNPFSDPSEVLTVEGITRSMNPFLEIALRKGLGAPEFYTDKQRLGFFGSPQQDVDVPAALGEMLTRSPGGRIIGEGPGSNLLGLGKPVDDVALRSRLLRARRQIRGIPNPEVQGAIPQVLPPRQSASG